MTMKSVFQNINHTNGEKSGLKNTGNVQWLHSMLRAGGLNINQSSAWTFLCALYNHEAITEWLHDDNVNRWNKVHVGI